MDMETLEEFTGSSDQTLIIKGKRTKRRQRPSSPFGVAMITSSSSSSGGGGGGGQNGNFMITSPTTSEDLSTTTQEEEDMANCLILLAQGGGPKQIEEEGNIVSSGSQRFSDMSTTTIPATGKSGFYVYECKTCNRTFPSFQALGGHRASHKKPKTMVEEKKVKILNKSDYEHHSEELVLFNKISQIVPTQMAKPKVHECSICGSEFASGQALGGHMRRHRTSTNTQITMNIDATTTSSVEEDKPRHFLPLDLNLPAPEEDHNHRDSKYQFTPNQQFVFSAPALVHCHY